MLETRKAALDSAARVASKSKGRGAVVPDRQQRFDGSGVRPESSSRYCICRADGPSWAMATPPARPYRFPALPVKEEEEDEQQVATRCTRQSCGTCSASAVASCVALCLCPCAVVSCLTLALVKAPYVAGRRCVARIARRRLRKAAARRVRDLLDDEDDEHEQQKKQGPRRSKELWGCDLPRAAAVDDGSGRAKVSSRMDAASEEVWVDMYRVGLWGFGRLSFSAAAPVGAGRDDSEEDGDTAPESLSKAAGTGSS